MLSSFHLTGSWFQHLSFQVNNCGEMKFWLMKPKALNIQSLKGRIICVYSIVWFISMWSILKESHNTVCEIKIYRCHETYVFIVLFRNHKPPLLVQMKSSFHNHLDALLLELLEPCLEEKRNKMGYNVKNDLLYFKNTPKFEYTSFSFFLSLFLFSR